MAWLAWGVPESRHHPLPDNASSHALRTGTPFLTRKSAIALVRLHCFRRMQRSLRRSHSSILRSSLLQAAWRKYVTQPVVKLFASLIICPSAIPRLRRVMPRSRSFALWMLFGASVRSTASP